MKCPECKKELETINVFSQCVQRATVNRDGIITEYGSVDEVLDTEHIECSFCGSDITNYVDETTAVQDLLAPKK